MTFETCWTLSKQSQKEKLSEDLDKEVAQVLLLAVLERMTMLSRTNCRGGSQCS